jgi:Subtilase family
VGQDRADIFMVSIDLRNTVLIGLTVVLLASAAWWLSPQASRAQLSGVGSGLEGSATTQDRVADTSKTPPANSPGTPPVAKPKPPSLHHLLGIDTARARLGKAIPTGRGITVGHVEIGAGAYLPNTRSPMFKGVTFVERSGPSKVSGHAFATARVIYGLGGLAPGVSVVHCFESRDWMGAGYLNAGTGAPPMGGPMRVLTHSWVSDAPNAVDVLRRIDWQVDTYDTVVCVGVNNGRQTPVPYLLGTAYNVIAVGTAEGNGSSGGYTRIETRGRCKPDIVGPRGLTSFTTPAVAGCAARLLQAADEMTDEAHRAGKAEVIKAVLLAGAVKPKGWKAEPGHPLDEHLGAGVVQFDNSLQILQSGSADPGRLPRRMGWDFREIQRDQTYVYTFQTQAPMGEASIILTWHRRVAGMGGKKEAGERSRWSGVPRTANLDLRLVHTDDVGDERELAVSRSRVDNVEHIYLKGLDAGRYRLEVSRVDRVYEEPWDYALAWRVGLLDEVAQR